MPSIRHQHPVAHKVLTQRSYTQIFIVTVFATWNCLQRLTRARPGTVIFRDLVPWLMVRPNACAIPLLILSVLLHGVAGSSGAHVASTEQQLLELLQQPQVSAITLNSSMALSSASWSRRNHTSLARDLVIRGTPQPGSSGLLQLDFSYLECAVTLQPGVVLTFEYLHLLQVRHGMTTRYDFLCESPGAMLRLNHTAVDSEVCMPLEVLQSPTAQYVRPPEYGDKANPPYQVLLQPPTWMQQQEQQRRPAQGAVFVLSHDHIHYVPASPYHGKSEGGYTLALYNAVYACRMVMPAACLARHGVVGCTAHLLAQQSTRATLRTAGWTGLAVLAASILWALAQRQRQQQQGQSPNQHLHPAQQQAGQPGSGGEGQVETASTHSLLQRQGTGETAAAGSPPQQLLPMLGPSLHSWVHAPPATSPAAAAAAAGGPSEYPLLGRLVGFGSFGRVYEGVHKGQLVAVKVISVPHKNLPSAAAAVQLHLGLHHDNILPAVDVFSSGSLLPLGQLAGHAPGARRPSVIHAEGRAAAARGWEGPPAEVLPGVAEEERPGFAPAGPAADVHAEGKAAAAQGWDRSEEVQAQGQGGVSQPAATTEQHGHAITAAAAAAPRGWDTCPEMLRTAGSMAGPGGQQLLPVVAFSTGALVVAEQPAQMPMPCAARPSPAPVGGSSSTSSTSRSSSAAASSSSTTMLQPVILTPAQRQAAAGAATEPAAAAGWGSVCSSSSNSGYFMPGFASPQPDGALQCSSGTGGAGSATGPGVPGNTVAPRQRGSQQYHDIWLVTEFAGQGTLAEVLLPDGLLQEPAVKALGLKAPLLMLLDVARGMAYLHAHHIIHGDLKAENILLFDAGEDVGGVTGGNFWEAAPWAAAGSQGTAAAAGEGAAAAAGGGAGAGGGGGNGKEILQQSALEAMPSSGAVVEGGAAGTADTPQLADATPAAAAAVGKQASAGVPDTAAVPDATQTAAAAAAAAGPWGAAGPHHRTTRRSAKPPAVPAVHSMHSSSNGAAARSTAVAGPRRHSADAAATSIPRQVAPGAPRRSSDPAAVVPGVRRHSADSPAAAAVAAVLPVVAKVADFGLRRSLAPNATHISTQSHGTVTHVAPEVLTSSHMGLASDVYSFGILMWEVYCCKPPFEGLKGPQVMYQVVHAGERPVFPPGTPWLYRRLAHSCWDVAPGGRPSFDSVVRQLELLLRACDGDTTTMVEEL